MSESEATIRANEVSDEDRKYELSLRPTQLAEYIGQTKVKDNLRVFMKAALSVAKLSTIFCLQDLRALVKLPFRISSPMKWALR